MNIDNNDTAIVVIDPQNDVLSEKRAAWKLVGDSVKENKTVENIERIFKAAKQHDFEKSLDRRTTTWFCNCGSATSVK